jgi:hypothetical protein
MKIDLLFTWGPTKSLKLLVILSNESKHNILCLGRQGQQNVNLIIVEKGQDKKVMKREGGRGGKKGKGCRV